MSMQGLQRLEVWKRAKDFALRIYLEVLPLLPPEEKWNLSSQLRRSSSSIPANIAEGYGRFYYQENVRFCYTARGSLEETLSYLVFSFDAKYIPETLFEELSTEGDEIGRMLNGYITYLKRSKQGENEPGSAHVTREIPEFCTTPKRRKITDLSSLLSVLIKELYMKVPISWLKDFVDIDIPIPDLAHLMTMAGLEVEEIRFIGLPIPKEGSRDASLTGIEWDPEKLVVASISEVMPHPNADRLVLCKLFDGQQEHIVLTGAPNLFEYKGKGPLPKPLKVAYAKEGAQIYDGHADGQVLVTLKRAKIRGVESYSMVCSEKELGISDEHEGIIILDEAAPAGMPLVDYLGDAVMEVSILPSTARCANMLGVAREIAAITGKPLKQTAVSDQQVSDRRRGFCRDRDHQSRTEPAFRARPDPGYGNPPQPLQDTTAPETGRDAPHQQYRGCHQLCHAGNWRAAACLRL